MTKNEALSAIEKILDRWSVPRHMSSVTDQRGAVRVELLAKGASKKEQISIPTGRYVEGAKEALADLEAVVRRGWQRRQKDIEDFAREDA